MLKVANGIIESKKTKEIDKDNVKQSSFTNSSKDTENNLYAKGFVRMFCLSRFKGGYRFDLSPWRSERFHLIIHHPSVRFPDPRVDQHQGI
jgi:hypothetical protein